VANFRKLEDANCKKNFRNLFYVGCKTERKATEVCACESMLVSRNEFFSLPENPLRDISLEDVTYLHVQTFDYSHNDYSHHDYSRNDYSHHDYNQRDVRENT
jgi:hypothetical protein